MSVHTVTVTALPNIDEDLPDDQYIDTVQFIVECPPSENCSVWWECERCTKDGYKPTEDEDDDGEYTRHDLFHQRIDGSWMFDSGHCAATNADSASDAMQEEAEESGLGTHQIDLQYDGDGTWSATRVIPPEERARIDARAKELYEMSPRGQDHPWEGIITELRDYYRHQARQELRNQ